MSQFNILLPYNLLPNCIIACLFAITDLYLSKPIIAEPVHETVPHSRTSLAIYSILSLAEKVFFLDPRIDSTCNPNHPQKLINIIS